MMNNMDINDENRLTNDHIYIYNSNNFVKKNNNYVINVPDVITT